MNNNSWRPTATVAMLHKRAAFLASIRAFFHERHVLEVETPLLASSTALDPHLASIKAAYHAAPGVAVTPLYLQTSPEYAMKRLLAAGSGPIFQLGRAFRDGERGRRHNPEFTLLEWYRPGFDLTDLMAEVAELVKAVCGVPVTERLTYRAAFQRYTGLDPFFTDDVTLSDYARSLSGLSTSFTKDDALDVILSHEIEPKLGAEGGTFIYHYPPSQAALARTCEDDGVQVAQRFELYIRGIEIANGYYELTDVEEQARRFKADNTRRAAMHLPEIPLDTHFLAALRHGMPDCAGVALGVDRLLMIAVEAETIDEVISFPIDIA